MKRMATGALVFAIFLVVGPAPFAAAQGLIVTLPKDGAWVRFEGTVKQVELRPEAAEGDITMEWIQHLTIKSVGSEKAAYRGQQVPCRWIEIKVVTGKSSEAGVEAGPVGERLYKVLVPEERVVAGVIDREKIPFSFLDIVKGFRKVGADVKPIGTGALQVFPLIAPLMHYDALEPAGDEEVPAPGGAIAAKKFKATRRIESPTTRTINEAEIWRCSPEKIPFGVARWLVKTTLEKKDNSQPRSAFKAATQMTVDMSAHEWGTGAKSELLTK